MSDDVLAVRELAMTLRITYLDYALEIVVVGGMAEAVDDGAGGLDLTLGGVVPLHSMMDIVLSLGGGGDAQIRETLETLVPLMVDSRTEVGGPRDGISGSFLGHAVPVFLYEE